MSCFTFCTDLNIEYLYIYIYISQLDYEKLNQIMQGNDVWWSMCSKCFSSQLVYNLMRWLCIKTLLINYMLTLRLVAPKCWLYFSLQEQELHCKSEHDCNIFIMKCSHLAISYICKILIFYKDGHLILRFLSCI